MTRVLLTGAGFSRNWGGPVASEMFNRLIGAGLDNSIRELLVSKRAAGGFEAALYELQEAARRDPSDHNRGRLQALTAALYGIFNGLVQDWSQIDFEFQNEIAYMVRTYLIRFDAIFTLNQDTLLEQHYLDDNILLGSGGRWQGWAIPGTRLLVPEPHITELRLIKTAKRVPSLRRNSRSRHDTSPTSSSMALSPFSMETSEANFSFWAGRRRRQLPVVLS